MRLYSASGPFWVEDEGRGTWRLTASVPAKIDIFVRSVQLNDADGAGLADCLARCTGITLEWLEHGVRLTILNPDGDRVRELHSAIVHESKDRLYEALPLPGFDAAARRFWRRIFRLVRIPGGRLLLGFLARRTRRR